VDEEYIADFYCNTKSMCGVIGIGG